MNHFFHNASFDDSWFTYPNLYQRFVRENPSDSKFVEIGCWKGRSAAFLAVEMINANKGDHLWCVDTWHGDTVYANQTKDMKEAKDSLFNIFLQNLESVKHVITPSRKTSLEAAMDFPNEYFDAVFIDADHEYENVLADMHAWYPKVKIGGFFCGHDYPGWPGVVKAVDEFFKLKSLKLEISEGCWISKK